MKKIKIICDSSCDIKKDFAVSNNIEVLPITIIFDDKEYKDYYDFDPDEFYKMLDENTGDLPSTSQVAPKAFIKAYEKAASEGYDEVIVITINSLASGTFQSSNIAKTLFLEENPDKLKIYTINSKVYSCLISVGIRKAVEMIKEGKESEEICELLNNFYPKSKAVVAVGTLDNLIKTGRISKVTGAVGGLLNIKPIVEIANEKIDSIDKVRGNA
ncbi:MAG: DegV family protein, partial [Clostridia bacterium]